MKIKKYFGLAIASFVIVLLLHPQPASAATSTKYEQLTGAIKHAYSLCALDSKQYKASCEFDNMFSHYVSDLKNKSEADQDARIDKIGGKYDSRRQDVEGAYVRAVGAGRLNSDGTIKQVSGDFTGDCGSGGGGVELSVGINKANECVGSATDNPIYAYLRGVIKLLGGLIGLALVITLIVAGIQYSASGGEPANIAKAKDRIFNGVIGLILYILLASILRYLIPNVFS